MFDIKKLDRFPTTCGVYLMRGSQNKVLYIGKANNLKMRVKQYFAKGRDERKMVPFLIKQILSIDTIVTLTEKEALILENNLIKEHKPKYNVLLKDDKTFITLMVNHRHNWPMIRLLRLREKPKKDGLYFGPFTSAFAARRTLDLMQRIFPLRQCSDSELKRRIRPCLLYGIKRCLAPCVNKCTKTEYEKQVKGAIEFLKGKDDKIIENLRKEIELASENLEFEKAEQLSQTLRQIETITKSSKTTVQSDFKNSDVIGLYQEINHLLIVQMIFREGRLIGQESFNFSSVASNEEESIETFLLQHYQSTPHLPDEILIPFPLEKAQVISELIHVKLVSPMKGGKKKLIKLAETNAKHLFQQFSDEKALNETRLNELREQLNLTQTPIRIECFDTSNTSGDDPVASMIAFTEGVKDKKRTRLYKIKGKSDDYSAMREVLSRRLIRSLKEDDLPDLIIVDGGKGQLNVAKEVLKELEIATIDLIAITKEEARHDKGLTKEKIFFPHKKEPLSLDKTSPLLFFLQQIRDESHRIAIEFQRKNRKKKLIKSVLDEIEGIGPQKKKRLLNHFRSIKRIEEAGKEELKQVLSQKDAETIHLFFKNR